MSISQGRWIAALTTALAVIVAAPAPAATGDLEEIVVTARKRVETMQSIPESINAFGAQEISDARIDQTENSLPTFQHLGDGATRDEPARE